MYLKSLTIKNFRNHDYLSFNFENKVNAFIGPNGVGKTNVAEAIHYLSLARSFRTLDESELIKEGKDDAFIEATIDEGGLKRKIKVHFTRDGRSILLNNKPIKKISELSKITNVILFEPKDVMLFRGSPKTRRQFLDVNLSKKSAAYLNYISMYEKLMKERNDALKASNVDFDLLKVQTDMMIKIAGPIIAYREQFVKDINNILIKIIRALTGKHTSACVKYLPFVPYDSNFESNAKKAFARAQETDLKRKLTSIGPHRDDFIVSLNDKDIASFGSQGENRLVALSLKLSPFFLIEDKDKRPIIVLDDVLSELDNDNKLRLLKFMERFEQVFITATKLDYQGINIFPIKKKGESSNGRRKES